MRLFTAASPFDSDVEKVTPEEDKGTEDWGTILDICEKVGNSSLNAKECLKSIVRRLNHANPHVVLKAIMLLDACVNNCSKVFHLEIASREFESEFRKLLKKSQPKIADNLKQSLKKWAENDFKSDPQLSLIPSLYNRLKQEGVDFPANQEPSKISHQPKDPNAVTSQQEVDDIARAIELSLKETKLSSGGSSSLYPTASSNFSSNLSTRNTYSQSNSSKPQPKHIVKALYDFEAVEDNELTFYTGEIIEVLDDSDKNWWKGMNHRGEGLFPANFVTSDLTTPSGKKTETETASEHTSQKNRVHFSDTATIVNEIKQESVVINEQKIDRLMHLLHEANPTDESADTGEMLTLEDEVNAMSPLIDTELEKVDRKHAQLTQLSINLVDALNLYHSLMREPAYHTLPGMAGKLPYMVPPSVPVQAVPHPHQVMYNGGMNGPYPAPAPPPGSMMNDQYPANTMPSSIQQPSAVHQQQIAHHFMPITSLPVQAENNGFHHQSRIQSAENNNFHPQPVMKQENSNFHSQNMMQNPQQQPPPPHTYSQADGSNFHPQTVIKAENGNFHPQTMIQSQPPPSHTMPQNMPSNMVPVQYHMPQNAGVAIPQMPHNMYQQVQQQVPPQDVPLNGNIQTR